MQPLAFLWFELQFVQHYFRETFAESQAPAKARMAPSLFRNRRIYEACNKVFSVHCGDGHRTNGCIGPRLSRTRCGRISLDKMKAGSSMSQRFANIDH